ncbi:hypothetical protein MHYP_G00272940 [Metynnis hypsauchen]
MILYNRKKVKYRKDGYCWKKRKDGKTTREDHMKLKVQGVEARKFDSRRERVNTE